MTFFFKEQIIEIGKHVVSMTIPAHFFSFGAYYMDVMLAEEGRQALFIENDIVSFSINPKISEFGSWMGKGKSYLKPKFDWEKHS